MEKYDVEERLPQYHQACRLGTDWLLTFTNEDGSIGPVEDSLYYYQVPWTYAIMGEFAAASRLLDWIYHHMFTPEGAFEGVSPQGQFETRVGSYPLACLIIGATSLRRFDIVYRGTRRLFAWQDPESGGFYQRLDGSDEQEILTTAQGGMTFIMVGQIEAARKAGEWMKRLWDLQPDVEHRLHPIYSPSEGLVTDYAPDREIFCVVKKDDPWQRHFSAGMAAAFLTKLYMATGEKDWLDLARKYEAFSMTTDECQFQSMQVCKSSWGGGLLYVATRERQYRDWTVRMGDWYLESQFEDGHWEDTKHWVPHPTAASNIEITSEFVRYIADIIMYLSVREER